MPPLDTEVSRRSIYLDSKFIKGRFVSQKSKALANLLSTTEEYIGRRRHWHKATHRKMLTAVECLLAHFGFIASHPYRYEFLAVSRSGKAVTGNSCIDHSIVARAIDLLCSLGFCELAYRGWIDRETGVSANSRYRITDSGLQYLSQAQLIFFNYPKDPYLKLDPIENVLRISEKDGGKSTIPFCELRSNLGQETLRRMGEKLIGCKIRCADLTHEEMCQCSNFRTRESYKRAYFRGSNLVRTFTESSLSSGGRIWLPAIQQLPKIVRSKLKLDESPVIELDFQAMQLHLLNHFAGNPLAIEGDPYQKGDLQSFDRSLVKEIFKRFLGSPIPLCSSRVASTIHKSNFYFKFEKLVAAYDTFLREYACLSEYFFIGIGRKLEVIESEIALSILDQALEMDSMCIPIHESFIVQKDLEPSLRGWMVKACKQAGLKQIPSIEA